MMKTTHRLHNHIAGELGSGIVSGVYAPGDVLPGEIEFSERLSVSRTAYREAVRMLAAKGLVESKPKIGTRVNARSRWNLLDQDVLGWLFGLDSPDQDLVRDLFEVRRIIEPAAAVLAAQRHGETDATDMASALSLMEASSATSEEGMRADRAFHEAIFRATGNQVLMSLSDSICAIIDWTTRFKERRDGALRSGVIDHQRVHDAIVSGDGRRAELAMIDLLQLAFEDVRLTIEEWGGRALRG
ncbi:MAG: FadR/GntR family transcriptional regulator [Phyllobacterium sp.]